MAMDGVGAAGTEMLADALDAGFLALPHQGVGGVGDLLKCDAGACHIVSLSGVLYYVFHIIFYMVQNTIHDME
ncbi:hypothetical protein [Halomonas sp. QHL1]|uniref:hypothetical protein n=1 Tax=Halomonas sp. QHL1 TaxID=1123773 RepID=UPI0020C88244|nr:hypothetical protein [Halomonas sp. QHL1]